MAIKYGSRGWEVFQGNANCSHDVNHSTSLRMAKIKKTVKVIKRGHSWAEVALIPLAFVTKPEPKPESMHSNS